MRLIANCEYRVTIRTSRKRFRIFTAQLTYCGGGVVDDEGHWMSGGLWSHPNTEHPNIRYFEDLDIVNIRPVPRERWKREWAK